jgi:hypothetical protein
MSRSRFRWRSNVAGVIVYAVFDDALSPNFPLGDSIEAFVRREDAERCIEDVPGDDLELASYLRIEERELEAGAPSGNMGQSESPEPHLRPRRFSEAS